MSREENDQLVDAYKSDNFGDDSGNEINDISEGNIHIWSDWSAWPLAALKPDPHAPLVLCARHPI